MDMRSSHFHPGANNNISGIIERLGLRNSSSGAGGPPKFDHKILQNFQHHLKTEVDGIIDNMINNKSTLNDIQKQRRKGKFLYPDAEMLVEKYGEAVWGSTSREHLVQPSEDSETGALYFDNPGHRLRITELVCTWLQKKLLDKVKRQMPLQYDDVGESTTEGNETRFEDPSDINIVGELPAVISDIAHTGLPYPAQYTAPTALMYHHSPGEGMSQTDLDDHDQDATYEEGAAESQDGNRAPNEGSDSDYVPGGRTMRSFRGRRGKNTTPKRKRNTDDVGDRDSTQKPGGVYSKRVSVGHGTTEQTHSHVKLKVGSHVLSQLDASARDTATTTTSDYTSHLVTDFRQQRGQFSPSHAAEETICNQKYPPEPTEEAPEEDDDKDSVMTISYENPHNHERNTAAQEPRQGEVEPSNEDDLVSTRQKEVTNRRRRLQTFRVLLQVIQTTKPTEIVLTDLAPKMEMDGSGRSPSQVEEQPDGQGTLRELYVHWLDMHSQIVAFRQTTGFRERETEELQPPAWNDESVAVQLARLDLEEWALNREEGGLWHERDMLNLGLARYFAETLQVSNGLMGWLATGFEKYNEALLASFSC